MLLSNAISSRRIGTARFRRCSPASFDVVLTMGPNEETPKGDRFFQILMSSLPILFLVAADGPLAKLPHSGEHLSTDTEEGQKALAEIKEALNGMTLGASLSTSQLKFVEQNFGDVVEVKTYKSSEQVQLDIEGGRLDGQFR